MSRKQHPSTTPQLDLIPFADVDLIRFEKNLLQIGFFAAQEERKGPPPFIRRIENTVNRDGQRISVVIEFRASIGLPSTADRDKFMAFLKIAAEQRARYGRISNPIRFTGYRLLQELGLNDSGPNYEDLNSWGERMATTTITSRQVIFFALSKRYANKTIHVFESFQRVGKQSGNTRSEEFEVVLAEWLLDNLNTNYVISEDFIAYRQLKRPTAKGIFGPLHLWFKASQGRVVEKDYRQLCMLLGIQPYAYLSKIKSTMGKALDELVTVRYLSRWDVQPMSSKDGYKIVLWPGADLLSSLALSTPRLAGASPNGGLLGTASEQAEEAEPSKELTMDAQQALTELLALGIAPAMAQSLVKKHDSGIILDVTEYVSSLVTTDKSGRIHNPAGLLIYYLNSDVPIPDAFTTSRKRRRSEASKRQQAQEQQHDLDLQLSFAAWREQQVDAEIAARYPGPLLNQKIAEVVAQRSKSDKYFIRVNPTQREILARQILVREVREQLALPPFEDWCKTHAQYDLFVQ
jgi:hypothetical protein